jgi:hypothetical protein
LDPPPGHCAGCKAAGMAWTIKPAIKAWRSSGEQSACGCCCHLLLSSWAWWAALPMTGRERLVRARSQSSLSTRCWSPHLWGAEGAVGNLAVDVMWRPSIGIDRCSRGRTPTFGRSFSKFVQCILRSLLLHLNTRSFYPADIIDHIFFCTIPRSRRLYQHYRPTSLLQRLYFSHKPSGHRLRDFDPKPRVHYHRSRRQQITAGRACFRTLIAEAKQSVPDIANSRHGSPC